MLDAYTNFEAVAVRAIIFGGLTTICCLYVPPDYHLGAAESERFVNQLPPPFIKQGI